MNLTQQQPSSRARAQVSQYSTKFLQPFPHSNSQEARASPLRGEADTLEEAGITFSARLVML